MFDSLQKLMKLSDCIEVYPGHYAGSVCGSEMSLKTVSTIGYERRHNAGITVF